MVKENIKIAGRMYDYIRHSAISNITDALVELITNSVDAYEELSGKMNKKMKRKKTPFTICINLDYIENKITVIDSATGIDGGKMKICFLTVGEYTSGDNKRGHFSRGAKDISSLGDIIFTSIRNNKLSKCIVYNDGKGKIVRKNSKITKNNRKVYGISNNGLNVHMDLKKVELKTWNKNDLYYHFALRDILSNKNYKIILNSRISKNKKNIKEVMEYKIPESDKIIDITYNVEKYNVPARFELYKFKKDYKHPSENGIIIKSNTTIYENSLLDKKIWRSPYFYKYHGVITCNYIHTLLKKCEKGYDKKNPLPIIEPSRLSGLNRDHPFVNCLLKIPIDKFEYVMLDTEFENRDVELVELGQLFYGFDELQEIGADILSKYESKDISKSVGKGRKKGKRKVNVECVGGIVKKLKKNAKKASRSSEIMEEDESLKYSSKNIAKKNGKMEKEYREKVTGRIGKVNIAIDSNLPHKYIYTHNKDGIFVTVSDKHPIMKKYLGDRKKNYPGLGSEPVRYAMAEMLTEAFSRMLAELRFSEINVKTINPRSLMRMMNEAYYENYRKLEPKIYRLVLNNARPPKQHYHDCNVCGFSKWTTDGKREYLLTKDGKKYKPNKK
tara:strand:+ start:918 stop:2759 length:1842 start_codon:yes stop_codon:yes gene_type:complete